MRAYLSGGSAGAVSRRSSVELYNPTGDAIPLRRHPSIEVPLRDEDLELRAGAVVVYRIHSRDLGDYREGRQQRHKPVPRCLRPTTIRRPQPQRQHADACSR